MDRRTFLTWVGVSWVASSLPVALAACSNQTSEPVATATVNTESKASSRQDGFIEAGTIQDLNKTGRLLQKQASDKSVLVIQDPTASKSIHAFEAVCTHKGCEVDWRADDRHIFCPCHGSTFNPDGTVFHGPATQPLKRYETKVEGNTVLVKMS